MAWAHAQGAGADQSGTTGTQSYPGACTVGSVLWAWVRLGSGGSAPIVSDPTNGTWTKHMEISDLLSNVYALHSVVNTASTALTVTLANTTSVTRRWGIEEATHGTDTTSLDTAGVGANGFTATTAATDAITSATNDEIYLGGIERNDGSSANSGASGTTITRNVATGKAAGAYKVIATAGSGNTLDFSWTGADAFGCGGVLYKFTAGAAVDALEWRGCYPDGLRRFSGLVGY